LPRVDLARVVDLATALEADAGADADALRRRDRSLGRELASRADDATARVVAWLDRQQQGGARSPGTRVRAAQRALRTLLAGAGIALGVSTSLALFAYDGVHPINVIHVLAVFAAMPIALLVGTAVLMLPESWRRRVPGLAAVQDVLRLVSPGRWLPALRRLLRPAEREAFDRAIGLARRHHRLYGDAQKWALLVASQLFAVSFYATALGTAALLVVATDLAFGWSTTWDAIDARSLHAAAELLAAPWSRWLPDAVPSAELIEHTQYFRGAGGFAGNAPRSAAWWRFLLACMACYGLAPRAALLAVAGWRQRIALRRAFAALPGAAELRDRLDSRWIATADGAAGPAPAAVPGRARAAHAPRPARVRAVRWSGLALADGDVAALVSRALGSQLTGVVDGGAGSGRSDRALLTELAGTGDPPALLVKAWEPPLAELLDWLGELRDALGTGVPILVLPVAQGAPAALADPAGVDARIWARSLAGTGDPWLFAVSEDGA
jgi:uncharacterized protein DUF2868